MLESKYILWDHWSAQNSRVALTYYVDYVSFGGKANILLTISTLGTRVSFRAATTAFVATSLTLPP